MTDAERIAELEARLEHKTRQARYFVSMLAGARATTRKLSMELGHLKEQQ